MTEKTIVASILAGCTLLLFAAFVRRGVIYCRRLHRTAAVSQQIPRSAELLRYDMYRTRFLLNRGGTFASRKTIRIRPEYYERLRRITAQRSDLSLIAYVDNVLRAHFEDYGAGIDRHCLKEPFNGGK